MVGSRGQYSAGSVRASDEHQRKEDEFFLISYAKSRAAVCTFMWNSECREEYNA